MRREPAQIKTTTDALSLWLPMLINLLQRHHLWIFVLLSGLSGLATGHLGATAVGFLANPALISGAPPRGPAKQTAARAPLVSYQTILKRNIFNSAGATQSFKRLADAQTAKNSPVKTASKWTLVGTISGGHSPLATLSSNGETATYRLNENLPDGAVLSAIARNRAELRYPDGRVQVLELIQNKLLPAVPPRKTAQKPRVIKQQVENLGQNRWRIPARVAEDARSNIGNLLRQAQAVPYLEGKKTTGFQIIMIQPGSMLAQIGLKKGDILREINGLQLNSPEKALQIFGQLRQAKQVSIGLERRGKAMTFAYEIR